MELLAPVGSISALKAAISAGADAVYLGLSEHNARIKADSFNVSNLKEWVGYAHLFGVKVHITLNTAVKDEEWDRLLFLAKVAVESGADALIVSDLGLVKALSQMTDIPLHLSTQAGAQNHLDARFARSLGVTRVILARETVNADIPSVCDEVKEVECFVQGALCVSFSGGCLLGSVEYGCSGNRGVCNQACRMRYSAVNKQGETLKTGYFLSPYDLCVGEDILSLRSAGAASAKIEGRLKRGIYVYYAVAYYRAILDGKDPSDALNGLKKAFNRGFTKGYTLKKSDRIINGQVPTHIGVSVGIVEKVVTKNGYKYAYVKSSHPFHKGDGAKILRKGIEVGGSDVTSVHMEGMFSVIPVSEGICVGDEVRLTTDSVDADRIERLENKLPISIVVSGRVGTPLTVSASCKDSTVTIKSDFVLETGCDAENISLKEKLSKLGNTEFYASSYADRTGTAVFIPVKELNAIRREISERLRKEVICRNTPNHSFESIRMAATKTVAQKNTVIVELETPIKEAMDTANAVVWDLKEFSLDEIKEVLEASIGRVCYLRLPRIARDCDVTYVESILRAFPSVGIYTDSMYGVELARMFGRRYIAGYGLNVFNSHTAALFSDADYVCASLEWAYAGDLHFAGGKIPLMSFAHCPISVVYGCQCGSCDRSVDELFYKKGEKCYLIRRNRWRDCCFTMYENKVSFRRPIGATWYSFVGATEDEKKALIESVKEGARE